MAAKNIYTAEDLINVLGGDISSGATRGNQYIICNPIDCSKCTDFTPLGGGSNQSFDGRLDGGGHGITNLTITPLQVYDLGLFAKIGMNGVVENLKLEHITMIQRITGRETGATITRAGGIAAVCEGTISGCSASGTITLQTKSDNCLVGGLCGSLPFKISEVNCSWADVRISFQQDSKSETGGTDSRNYSAGGIAGSSNGKISSCHSRSEIIPPESGVSVYAAGGICGVSESCSVASACYHTGYLHCRSAESSFLGGITGTADPSAAFSNCFYFKGCFLSDGSEKIGSIISTIGGKKSWEELTAPGFSPTELGADYMDTPADDYTYTPSLKVFGSIDEKYRRALCTPAADLFTQDTYPGTANPVKITCTLFDCTLEHVLLTAARPDQITDTPEPVISGNSFSCRLTNNTYTRYGFVLTLKDKFDRIVKVSQADIEAGANTTVILPYIEDVSVNTWSERHSVRVTESVSGFTEKPEMRKEYDYEDYRYHWVGNSSGTTIYYAEFSANAAGAAYMTVKDQNGQAVLESAIKYTETIQWTDKLTVRRKNSGFSFETLTFVIKNTAGIEASVPWEKAGQTAKAEKPSAAGTEDRWRYPLKRLTWSLTACCNLSCRHCASRDIHDRMTDLSGPEIRRVTEDIIKLNVSEVCLTGGEILLSPYWYETAEALSRTGIQVSIITNGTLIDGETAVKIKKAGISYVAVSIDDFGDQEDIIRGKSNYEKALKGVENLKTAGIFTHIITTVHAHNIDLLEDMRRVFTAAGADAWCLRPMFPFGEAARNQEIWLDERDISRVMEYCYQAMHTEGIPIIPYASFEMHSEKGAAVLRALFGENIHTDFQGSDAGIFAAQLHPDGNLVGICVCSPSQSAGNVKERSLVDIWEDPGSFKALRRFDPTKLKGYCGICDRRDTCKGGDLNARLAFGGITAENRFCTYRNFKLYGITI